MKQEQVDLLVEDQAWYESKRHTNEKLAAARLVLEDLRAGIKVLDAIRAHPLQSGGYLSKSILVAAYRQITQSGEWTFDPEMMARIRMKPGRTLSGVTTVTVLTKPYPCPGKCIFCPTDVRMPKSYLPDEPGARRALQHDFDPYDQVASRIAALNAVGHPTNKIELLILGGTWSSYRRDYQEWFIRRCFEAMNGVESETLVDAQRSNERSRHRNVGLVVETRPDHVDPDELAWLRYLGVTKVQMGAQSFDDRILDMNRRGHSVDETRRAVALLRSAGIKIVLHWMPNLLGATPTSDRQDFERMWDGFCPDEIKIYPNQLLENAELYNNWQQGEYHPYSTEELIELIADVKRTIPRYCRVNRVIRDIPSTNVVEGNKRTSLRQDVQRFMKERGESCQCVRCREVRGRAVMIEELTTEEIVYSAGGAEEHFLSFVTPEDKLAGFLRLSLPGEDSPDVCLEDLTGAAVIREVHVYGQSVQVGKKRLGAAQHVGLGRRLVRRAERIARRQGYERIAVIAAIGTRGYYAKLGYQLGGSYMFKMLD